MIRLAAVIIAAVIGYLFGSINSSIFVVRLIKGQDIRTMGSNNAGLTNTLRCCGGFCALLTLIGDLSKGIIAVWVSRLIADSMNAGLSGDGSTKYIGYVAGLFAIIGHVFPLYFGFKGGKGVLVGVASFLMIDPKVFLVLLVVFIIVILLSNYVSLSSIIAASCCPFATFILSYFTEGNTIGRSAFYTLLTLPMSALVVWMHRSNIERLKNGTEHKFRKSKEAE